MRVICGDCAKIMDVIENDFPVKDEEVGGFPSTVRFGDLYKCPECHGRIITGFGRPLKGEAAKAASEKALEYRTRDPWISKMTE
jgi:hypothetical protein